MNLTDEQIWQKFEEEYPTPDIYFYVPDGDYYQAVAHHLNNGARNYNYQYQSYKDGFKAALSLQGEAVPVGEVWQISSKTFSILFASEQVANEWLRANGMNTASTYIQPIKIAVFGISPTLTTEAELVRKCAEICETHRENWDDAVAQILALLPEGSEG